MYCFIKLYSTFFDILKKKIKNGCNLKFFKCFRVPSVQPRPGCKVCMASLGEEENFTV